MGRVTLASLGPLGDELGSGGQGTVYALPESQSPSLVYKAYSEEMLTVLDTGVLAAMIEVPFSLSAQDRHELLAAAAWPRDIVTENDRVRGFTMALVPQRFHTTLKLLNDRPVRLGQAQLLLNPSDYLDRVELRIDDQFRLELLADVARTLRLFHRLGLTVGDMSPNNLIYSRTGKPRCHFIDCDAMQLNGRTVLPQVETTDWEVPAGGGVLGSKVSDTYKFALLCVRLFAGDQSTTDPSALLRAGPGIHALAIRALSGDAGDSPGLGTWEKHLRAARPILPKETVRVTVPSSPIRTTMPSPRTAVSRPSAAPAPVRPSLTRSRRRRLVKLVVLSLFLGYVASHTNQIESASRHVAESLFSDDDAAARAQADEIAAVLSSSAPVRDSVKSAVTNLAACANVKRSVTNLGAASSARQQSLTAANGLQITDLPNGAVMKDQLILAFTHSKAADDAYRSWGLKLSKQGCRKSTLNGPDRKRGDRESIVSTEAKQQFADLWNQIGPEYGHDQVSYQNI
ncbi:hypothetical protein [Micromonospora saelicesensis]|uniref:hypothetical protein n=1 Tax=Micromonospora saelicesensis TaxID=285676 RepID=UPI000DC579D5|nr:hypothetical protein [Micromonospora saelicesensis]RAO50858.1 hypothetical protein PSN01_04422 [Micromonospora saelicesensis]